jgi:hypothetical protein
MKGCSASFSCKLEFSRGNDDDDDDEASLLLLGQEKDGKRNRKKGRYVVATIVDDGGRKEAQGKHHPVVHRAAPRVEMPFFLHGDIVVLLGIFT